MIPTPFEQMVAQKLIPEPIFAFYLQADASQAGELTFGGVDLPLFFFFGGALSLHLVKRPRAIMASVFVTCNMLRCLGEGGMHKCSSMLSIV